MDKVKYNLSKSVPIQIDQGKNVATMSGGVLGDSAPLVMALTTANTELQATKDTVDMAKQALAEAYSGMRDSSESQRIAFNNLGGLVQTNSDGGGTYILSCGYGIRSNGSPIPPVEDAPGNLRTRVNGVPGQVLFSWNGVNGARNYEGQKTTDLTGATGWESAVEMPSATKLPFEGLTSGTKYGFRVRAWGNGMPGPWSTPVQQMAP